MSLSKSLSEICILKLERNNQNFIFAIILNEKKNECGEKIRKEGR